LKPKTEFSPRFELQITNTRTPGNLKTELQVLQHKFVNAENEISNLTRLREASNVEQVCVCCERRGGGVLEDVDIYAKNEMSVHALTSGWALWSFHFFPHFFYF
jgi:hypothetical protein